MGIQVVIRDQRPIEKLYYSAGYEDICIFCATLGDLVVPSSAYPMIAICPTCATTKEPVSKEKKEAYFPFFLWA